MYDLYRYDTWFDLLYDNNRFSHALNMTDSRPMNKKLIKVHKGVDNILRFRVFDSDRKPANISHLRVKGTFINKDNRERVLSVYGTLDCAKGTFYMSVMEGQLVNIAAGFYDFVITGEEFFIPEQSGEIVSTPFFTDAISNVKMEVEVTDGAEKEPVPTYEIEEWTVTSKMIDSVQTKLYYSSVIPASRLRNMKNGTHSITIKADAFRGKVYVCGSLEMTPPPASDMDKFFKLNMSSYTDELQYGTTNTNGFIDIFTGIDAWTFSTNVLWIVFYWVTTDDKGMPAPYNVESLLVMPDMSVVPNKLDRVQLR